MSLERVSLVEYACMPNMKSLSLSLTVQKLWPRLKLFTTESQTDLQSQTDRQNKNQMRRIPFRGHKKVIFASFMAAPPFRTEWWTKQVIRGWTPSKISRSACGSCISYNTFLPNHNPMAYCVIWNCTRSMVSSSSHDMHRSPYLWRETDEINVF